MSVFIHPKLLDVTEYQRKHLSDQMEEQVIPQQAQGGAEVKMEPSGIDPLTGDPMGYEPISKADLQDVAQMIGLVTLTLNAILLQLRLAASQMKLHLEMQNYTSTYADESFPIQFSIDGKRVSASNLIIQNNSGSLIYYDLDEPASDNSLQIGAGGLAEITNQSVGTLYLLTTAETAINKNGGIVIRAYGMPEQTHQRGQI